VVGGGFNSSAIQSFVELAQAGAATYGVLVVNDGPFSGTIKAQAICASGPGISAASAASSSTVKRAMQRKVDALRAQL